MKAALSVLLASACVSMLWAADPEPSLTPMRIKEVPEKQFFCVKKELLITEVQAFAAETFPELVRKATQLRLGQKGPLALTISGYQGDPAKSFTAEVDFPYAEKNDDYKGAYSYRTAPKFKCASMIFQGPVGGTGASWGKLVQAAISAGHQPTGESREVFLDFVGPDSTENIIELQLGID